jgi:hypothetical protein
MASLKTPVVFHIIPINMGLNYSEPPQLIDMRESPLEVNTHVYHGQVATRFGYMRKYCSADEAIYWTDVVYDQIGASANNVQFSYKKLYTASGNAIENVPVCFKNTAGTLYYDYFTWAPGASPVTGRQPSTSQGTNTGYISLDSGTSKYFPIFNSTTLPGMTASLYMGGGNAQQSYPSGSIITSTAYGNLMVFANPNDTNVFVMIPGTNGLTCDTINDGTGASLGSSLMNGGSIRAVCMYDNRLIVGGGLNESQVVWSTKGLINGFNFPNVVSHFSGTPFSDSGSINLADSPDWIQSINRLGEYCVVYKERSIYLGKTTTNSTSAAIEFTAIPSQGIGLAAPRSIGDLGSEHLFLGWDDIYSFSLNGITSIGDKIKDEIFYGSNGIMPKYLSRVVGTIAEEFDEYWLFVPTGRMADNWLDDEAGDIINVAGYVAAFPSASQTGSETPFYYNTGFNYIGTPTYTSNKVVWPDPALGAAGKPIGWTFSNHVVATSGSMDNALYPTVGAFGKNVAVLGFSSNTTASMTGTVTDGVASPTTGYIVDNVYSGMAWVLNPNSFNVSVTLTMGNLSRTVTVLPSTETNGLPQYIALSGVVTSGSTVVISALAASAGTLQIYGVQVTNIDMLAPGSASAPDQHSPSHSTLFNSSWNNTPDGKSQNYDPDRLYLDGYVVPGYNRDAFDGDSLDGDYAPQMLPFIIDRVGSWMADTVWTYNYKYESWGLWRMPSSGFGYDTVTGTLAIKDLIGTVAQQSWRFDEKLVQTQAPTNLLCREDGNVYEMSKSYPYEYNGFLNVPIYTEYQSKDFDCGDPTTSKTFSRLIIHHKTDHPAVPVKVSISQDSGVNWLPDQTVTIRNGETETYVDFFTTGTQHRFRIKTEEGPIAFSGFSVRIVPRGQDNAY